MACCFGCKLRKLDWDKANFLFLKLFKNKIFNIIVAKNLKHLFKSASLVVQILLVTLSCKVTYLYLILFLFFQISVVHDYYPELEKLSIPKYGRGELNVIILGVPANEGSKPPTPAITIYWVFRSKIEEKSLVKCRYICKK